MRKYEQIIRYAMQMEMDGYNFFKDRSKDLLGETSKAVFLELAEVELEHYEYLKKYLDKYMECGDFEIEPRFEDIDPEIFEGRAETEHVDAALKESDIPDITILRMAYLIEKDFKEFYEKAAEKADEPAIKKLFENLAEWEATHEDIFKKEYDRRMEEYMNLPWGG